MTTTVTPDTLLTAIRRRDVRPMLHQADCRYVLQHQARRVGGRYTITARAATEKRGFQACSVCLRQYQQGPNGTFDVHAKAALDADAHGFVGDIEAMGIPRTRANVVDFLHAAGGGHVVAEVLDLLGLA